MTDDSKSGAERRKAFRIDMEKEIIDISWQDESGQKVERKIVCLDFSRWGVKLDCDRLIAVNTIVTVVFASANPNSQKLTGKVIRCVQNNNGWYEVALQLETP